MNQLNNALARVESLLGAQGLSTKPKLAKARGSSVVASTETWDQAHKLVARFMPNLKALQKRINRGLLTADEIVNAVVEALRSKGVSQHLASAIQEVLKEALSGGGDVVDMDPAESPGVVDVYPKLGVDF